MWLERSITYRNHSTLISKVRKMRNQISTDYEGAIKALNNLQSNADYIRKSGANHSCDQLSLVRKYLERIGLPEKKLNELSVIHVAGTKGKGSTCAFTENILRYHGYRTGFFSSPHLLEVRERIRINGRILDKESFAGNFWRIYDVLNRQKDSPADMPLYFRFLTVMAFAIFVEKRVDVAIIEVGIGGEFDCTNILKKVPVIGITSLGIDHTSLLGNTIESIAWNKAGIMKGNCRAFTVPQSEAAMKVLKDRSLEKECFLEVINGNSVLKYMENPNFPSNVLNVNASLAVSLADAWMSSVKNRTLVPEYTKKALLDCVWPGRYQIIQHKTTKYYLDGAHTLESIQICVDWFKLKTGDSNMKKALVFNTTGNRNAENLLKPLIASGFSAVLFVPNVASKSVGSDSYDPTISQQILNCEHNCKLWRELEDKQHLGKCEIVKNFRTVEDVLEFLENQGNFTVLITGSLHLIGAVLSVIRPDLNDNTIF